MKPIVKRQFTVEDVFTTLEGYVGVCILNRHTGCRCGYVGVPPGHAVYGLANHHPLLKHIKTFAGLTFTGHRIDLPEEEHWYLGFDVGYPVYVPDIKSVERYWPKAELSQLLKDMYALSRKMDLIWTLEEVREEVKKLSAQLTPEALMAQKLMEE